MKDSEERQPSDRRLIHRLRVAAEHELELVTEPTPLFEWLAAEAEELATVDDEPETRR